MNRLKIIGPVALLILLPVTVFSGENAIDSKESAPQTAFACSKFIQLPTHTELHNDCAFWVRTEVWYPSYGQKLWYRTQSHQSRRGKFSNMTMGGARIISEEKYVVGGEIVSGANCLKVDNYVSNTSRVWRVSNSCNFAIVTRIDWYSAKKEHLARSDSISPSGESTNVNVQNKDDPLLTWKIAIADPDPE